MFELIGRNSELEELKNYLELASKDACKMVFISGWKVQVQSDHIDFINNSGRIDALTIREKQTGTIPKTNGYFNFLWNHDCYLFDLIDAPSFIVYQ